MRDNDKFVLSYTYLASYNSNSLNYETMTQILDFDMNPLTCQKYTKTNVNLQLEEKQFGTDENSNYYYNVLNKSISVSHYNTSLNMITVSSFTILLIDFLQLFIISLKNEILYEFTFLIGYWNPN